MTSTSEKLESWRHPISWESRRGRYGLEESPVHGKAGASHGAGVARRYGVEHGPDRLLEAGQEIWTFYSNTYQRYFRIDQRCY